MRLPQRMQTGSGFFFLWALMSLGLAGSTAWASDLGPLLIATERNRPVLQWQNQRLTYVVQSATNLGAPWITRATLNSDGTNITWTDDTPPVSSSFYRITSTSERLFSNLQQALRSACLNQGIVGASAAAMLPDHGLWIGTYGYSHERVPIQPHTPFEVASVTKTFVAVTVLRLVEEGVLSLDDTVGRWLPNLRRPNIPPEVTIRQLLSHRSGIHNFGDDPEFRQALFSDWSRRWKPEDVFDYVRAPLFSPDESGDYSNTGYVILGMIIQSATGASVAHEMRRIVFQRAGLARTYFGAEEDDFGEIAHPHLDFDGDGIHEDLGSYSQVAILTSFWTSGAVISTPADLVAFSSALFGGHLLSQGSLDSMRNFQTVVIAGAPYDFGLGLMRLDVLGREHWAHSGGLFGEYAWFSYCPSTGVSLGLAHNYPVTKAGSSLPAQLLIALANAAATHAADPSRNSAETELSSIWMEGAIQAVPFP